MDNSTQQTVSNQQSVVSDQATPVSSKQPTPIPRPATNRGGIPVEPIQVAPIAPAAADPVLPTEPVESQLNTDKVDSMPSVQPQSAPEPVADQVRDQSSTVQPSIPQPVSSPKSREHEPSAPFPDVVKMSEQQIQEEEGKVGDEIDSLIEESPDTEQPKISHELKIVGVEQSIDDIAQASVQVGSKTAIFPMTFDEAELTRKKYKWKDSIAWLSDLIAYHWKKLSFKNKK